MQLGLTGATVEALQMRYDGGTEEAMLAITRIYEHTIDATGEGAE